MSGSMDAVVVKLEELALRTKDVSGGEVYAALACVEQALHGAKATDVDGRYLWDALEKIFECKGVVWGHGLHALLAVVYTEALGIAPAFLLRGTFSTLVSIAGGKLSTSSRECAIYVLGKIARERGAELGVTIADAVTTLSKIIRSYDLAVRTLPSDLTLRATVYTSLAHIVHGSPQHTFELHKDLVKVAAKWVVADKCADVRLAVSTLLAEIACSSNGFKSVSLETVIATASKGLLDECDEVACAFAHVVAKCYAVQITAHREQEESARADLARGGGKTDAEKAAELKQSSSLSAKFKEAVSMKKKLVDKYDFQTMLTHQVTQVVMGEPPLRKANLFILHFMVVEVLPLLERSEVDWLLKALVSILKTSAVLALTHDESTFVRARLSYTFRIGIFSTLSESMQLECVGNLLTFMSTLTDAIDSSNDMQLVFILSEMAHFVYLLGESAASLIETIEGPARVLLRSSNFDVRTSAVFLLLAMSSVAPVTGAGYFRDALERAKEQAKQLMVEEDGGSDSRRKASKDTEKQQRLFLLHGQVLVVSVFMKNLNELPTGLPAELLVDALEFGLSLLAHDVMGVSASLRPIATSVMRAGSLIVSSALSVGFEEVKDRIPSILSTVKFLLTVIDCPTPSADAMPELMAIESTLIILSALLWFCPESLRIDEMCLGVVVDSLEKIFKAIKATYQSRFRGEYRFQIIHTMLLECFSWLPVGSYPNSSSALYTESMRVFKSSIEAGYETSWLSHLAYDDHALLRPTTLERKGSSFTTTPSSFELLLFDIDSFCNVLGKGEAEAWSASFPRTSLLANNPIMTTSPELSTETSLVIPPVMRLESRTIDAAISVAAAIFPFMDAQYKVRGVDVCKKLMTAEFFTGAMAMSMFTMDDDKRMKEKKSYTVAHNVTTLFAAILKSFPSIMILDEDSWVSSVMNHFFEVFTHPNFEIRSCAAAAMGAFCMKASEAGLGYVNDMVGRITSDIQAALVADLKAAASSDSGSQLLKKLTGHVLALTSFGNYGRLEAQLQLNITASLIACAKRTGSSIEFRSYTLYALASALQQLPLGSSKKDRSDIKALVAQACDVAVDQIATAGQAYDSRSAVVMLMKNAQRLINVCMSIISLLAEPSALVNGLITSWRVIRVVSSGDDDVKCESLTFVKHLVTLPISSVCAGDIDSAMNAIKDVLEHRGYHARKSLSVAVNCIRAIATANMDIIIKNEVDIDALRVVDWSSSASVITPVSHPLNVVIPEAMLDSLTSVATLQDELISLIQFLANVQVARNPDRAVVRWILIGQTVLSGGSLKDDGGGDDDDDEEGPEEDMFGEGEGEARLAAAVAMDTHQFHNAKRDEISSAAAMSSGLKTKGLVVQCTVKALKYCSESMNSMNSAHFNYDDAREKTTAALQKEGCDIHALPCYVVLFLEDALKLACSSSTYTADDKHMVTMQLGGMKLLKHVIDVFCRAEVNESTREIISQVVSQIVSALRPSLEARWQPGLTAKAGDVACALINGGYVSDMLVIKRLVRAMISACKPGDIELVERPQGSHDVADIVALESNVAAAHTMARLYLLASPSYDSTIGEDLRKQLSEFFPEEVLESIHKVWIALVLDGARVSQDTLHWPTATAESDPKRGGVCYPPVAKFRRIKYYLDAAMPVVLRACSLKPNMDQDSSKRLFGVAQCLLATFDVDGDRSGLVSERLNALSVFVNLASNDTSRQCIPGSEWTIVARHFVLDVLCGEEALGNSGEAVSMVRYLIDLLGHLRSSVTDTAVLFSLALYTTDALIGLPGASFFSSEAYNSKLGEKEVVAAFAEHMVSRAVKNAFPASTSSLAESGHVLKLLKLLLTQGDLASRGKIFAGALFANAILLMSQSSACRHPEVLVPLCQLLLAMYAVTEVDQRPEYLGVFIPALSTALLVNEGVVDFVLYGGRALTQFAATQPGSIRDCIQKLPEEHRASLQRAMKASMDQQQTITSPGGTASAPKALKKIDMSKFSKK